MDAAPCRGRSGNWSCGRFGGPSAAGGAGRRCRSPFTGPRRSYCCRTDGFRPRVRDGEFHHAHPPEQCCGSCHRRRVRPGTDRLRERRERRHGREAQGADGGHGHAVGFRHPGRFRHGVGIGDSDGGRSEWHRRSGECRRPTPTGPDGKGKATGGTDATTEDAYAYTHPCSARNLTVKVTSPQGFPATVRVVTVTNNGSTTCGLDFHPAIGFSAKGFALGIQATPPEGLGGAPAHPVRPGATTYAAVDLNPSGGGGPVADEINILADPSHMPNADGVSLPLATTGTVAKPRVGLYHFTARDSLDTL